MHSQGQWGYKMLEQMLALIQKSGTISPAELSHKMNIDPRMAEVLLEDLQRRGLLRNLVIESGCGSDGCDGCQLSSGCNHIQPRIWEISNL
jgi:DNA-binding IscR family transcriptional regulator